MRHIYIIDKYEKNTWDKYFSVMHKQKLVKYLSPIVKIKFWYKSLLPLIHIKCIGQIFLLINI